MIDVTKCLAMAMLLRPTPLGNDIAASLANICTQSPGQTQC